MGNMGYCRFQNTLRDLKDCLDALGEGEPVSKEEHRAAKRLIELAGEVASSSAPPIDRDDEED